MEMFIVSSGAVQVVGGPNDSIIFVTLGQGVCFGEIALLGTGGMNRRTASIKVTRCLFDTFLCILDIWVL